MKNGLDNVDGSLQPPPAKRIKLEEDPNQEDRLLSRKKLGKGRKRKMTKSTIEERALVLLNDDRISAVEPQQVMCRMCGHWVKLFKHTDFSAANWRVHAEKCEPRTGWKAHVQAEPEAKFTLTIPSLKPTRPMPADTPASTSPPSTITPAATTSAVSFDDATTATTTVPKSPLKPLVDSGSASAPVSRRPMKSTAERLQILDNDQRCEALGPHEVLCKICSQSVKLHNTREYDLWNWHRHVEKCEVKNRWVHSGSAAPQISNTLSESDYMKVDQVINPASPDEPHQMVPERSAANGFEPVAPVALVSERISGEDITIHAVGSTTLPDRIEADELLETEGLADQRALIVEGSEDIHSLGPDVTIPQSVSASTVAFVKPEPEEHNGLLYPTSGPEPDTEIEEIVVSSASISAGPKRRKGRTAEERRQVLEADTRTGEVRPHEVFCTLCSKWIKLYKDVEYVESNWMRHAERCSIRAATKGNVSSIISNRSDRRASRHRKEPSSSDSREERSQNLQDDPRVSIIDPFELRCQLCNLQWNTVHEYDTAAFSKHLLTHHPLDSEAQESQDRPRPITPRTRVLESAQATRNVKAEDMEAGPSSAPAVAINLTAPPRMTITVGRSKDESTPESRRKELELDGRCENIEPQRVTCKTCNRTVGLHLKKDYSLSNWYRHITSCGKGNKKVEKRVKPPVKTPHLSITFTRRTAASATASSNVTITPINAVNPPARGTAEDAVAASDTEVQMTVSAPAYVGKALKSTAEERRAKLLSDLRVAAVKSNRIQCRLCDHWLKLNEFMEYAPYNWYKHIERCEMRLSLKDQGTSVTPIVLKAEEAQAVEEVPMVEEVPVVEQVPMLAQIPVLEQVPVLEQIPVLEEVPVLEDTSVSADLTTRKRSTAAERLARMQADPRIRTIEKHRCRCGLCDKWVKLQNKTEYDAHNWFAHIKKCMIRSIAQEQSETLTSPTPETLEGSNTVNGDSESAALPVEAASSTLAVRRRELLTNDTRTTTVEPQRVLCAICNMWIKLRDGKQYVPYNWFKHRRKCERRHGLPETQIEMPLNEDSVSTPTVTKDIVKKESIPVDLSLYNNDPRKMTDEQRAAQLRADPRLLYVEPGRVFCKMCDSWIKLNMSNGFLRGNWLRHADRCRGRMSWAGMLPETSAEPPELSAVEVIDLEAENSVGEHFGFVELGSLIGQPEPTISSQDYGNAADAKPTPPPVKQLVARSIPVLRARPSTPTIVNQAPQPHVETKAIDTGSGKRPHRSEQMRKNELEDDPRTKIVLRDKILCALCDRWIQMRRDVAYSPQNWLKHAGICEQRTGWIKTHKSEKDEKPAEPVVRSQSEFEELVPYNARHVNEQPNLPAPSLTPVNWAQITYSDDDDDEDETVHTEAFSSFVVPPLTKPAPTSISTQMTTFGGPISQNAATTGVHTSKPQLQTPFTSLGVAQTHGENKPVPISGSATGIRRPTTTTPPVVSPFSTVSHHFYRATYPPPIGQQSYTASSKDGVPAKSVSPQNGGSQHSYQQQQRPMPFVVPASSMLPHLLPRPVLVPISHTATAGHQRSAIRSPFQLPATPPLPSGPPVPIAKSNGVSLPTPPQTDATMANGVGVSTHLATGSPAPLTVANGAGATFSPASSGSGGTALSTSTANGAPAVSRPNSSAAKKTTQTQASPQPIKSTEVTGVAVPTPIRSIFGQSVITSAGPSSSGGNSSTSPPVPVPNGITTTYDSVYAK